MSNTKFCGYDVHEVAEMLPLIPEGSRAWMDLVDSIKTVGQLDPIVVDGNVLIDGRNRLRACKVLGIVPITVEWSTMCVKATQDEWIKAKNLNRRDLSDDQKAMFVTAYRLWKVAREAAEAKKAGNAKGGKSRTESSETTRDHKAEDARSTVGKIAAEANVSHHKARQAIKLAKAAEENPEAAAVQEKVLGGETTLAEAKSYLWEVKKPREKAPEDEYSKNLWKLDYYWKRANKTERTAFLKIINAEIRKD